jgi:CheY-like chemotaxis protein
MTQNKVLVIDDDAYVTELLTQILTRARLQVIVARDGEEALARVASGHPDLIILDLMLPDVDGYVLLEKIKETAGWSFIPVMVLTASREAKDRLRGLQLGVIDYVTKPFERKDLLHRITSILEFNRPKEVKGTCSSSTIIQQKILSTLEQGKLHTLRPRLRRESQLGYDYADLDGIAPALEPGWEIPVLEEMVGEHLLERIFVDAIQLCPDCGHHDLNVRQACPFCASVDVEMEPTPPKSAALRPLEKSMSGLYLIERAERKHRPESASHGAALSCNSCHRTSARHHLVCRCMNCANQFEARKAVTKKIYAYKARAVAGAQPFAAPARAGTNDGWDRLPALFREFALPILDAEAFKRQVAAHVESATQRSSQFSLIGLHLRSVLGKTLDDERAGQLLSILKNTLRRFDVIGLRSATEWMILLPETPFTMSKIIAGRLYAASERMACEQPLDLSLASYPEDGVRAEELLEILELGIVTIPKGG